MINFVALFVKDKIPDYVLCYIPSSLRNLWGKNENFRTFLIFLFFQKFQKVEKFWEKMENYEFKFPKNKAYDDAGRGLKNTNLPSN